MSTDVLSPDLDSFETRLINAWRRSDLSLATLLTRAADQYEIQGIVGLRELNDVRMVETVERYVEEHCR